MRGQELFHGFAGTELLVSYYVIAGADHLMAFPKKQNMDWDQASLLQDKAESSEYFLVMGSGLTRVLALH